MSDQQPPTGANQPAGFYPDNTGTMRFWDGTSWTEHTQASGPAPTPTPAKKSHTVRNVILGVIAVFVLLIGGCLALVGGAANEISNSIDDAEAQDSEPGGPDNPLEITPGEEFSVSGFEYAGGWKIAAGEFGGIDVTGLKVTNNRDDKDSALVEIKFMQGTEVLALVDCSTEPVAVSQTTTLDCVSGDDLPQDYDALTINDSF